MYIVFCILCYRLQLYYIYIFKLKYGIYYVHKYIYVLQDENVRENAYTNIYQHNIHFAYPIFFFSAIVFICQLSLCAIYIIHVTVVRKYVHVTNIIVKAIHTNLMTTIFISSTVFFWRQLRDSDYWCVQYCEMYMLSLHIEQLGLNFVSIAALTNVHIAQEAH